MAIKKSANIFGAPRFDPLGSVHQVGATKLNEMAVNLDSATLRPGVGTTIQYTSGGMVISSKKQRRAITPPHPWKATSSGAEEVAIAAGEIMGIKDPSIGSPSGDITPYYFVPVLYEGGNVEVTGETGYIYAVATTIESIIHIDTYDFGFVGLQTQTRKTSLITVEFSADAPGDVSAGENGEVWIPICEVAKTDDVASVTRQILMHNPLLNIEIGEAVGT